MLLTKWQYFLAARKNIFLIRLIRLSRLNRGVCRNFQAAGINWNWCRRATLRTMSRRPWRDCVTNPLAVNFDGYRLLQEINAEDQLRPGPELDHDSRQAS